MNVIVPQAKQLIKDDEQLVLKAYPDPGSKTDKKLKGQPWTIGYGHTGGLSLPTVHEGDVITEAQADQYLDNDLNTAGAGVAKYVKVRLNDNQFSALVSFYFNVGETTFAKSSVLTYVNAGRFNEVPGRLALYRLADGKVMPGLVKRRQQEGNLWLTPVDGEVQPVVEPAEVNTNAGKVIQPAQASKTTGLNIPVIGGVVTTAASLSSDAKTAIGNITETLGINPSVFLLIVGVAIGGYVLWKHSQKDK